MENRKGEGNNRRKHTGTKLDGPKREPIIDLNKYKHKSIRVEFVGGRLVVGVLIGFDQLMNLVLEDAVETVRDRDDSSVLTDETRKIGFVVVRGPSLLTISPVDGSEVIENPFNRAEQ